MTVELIQISKQELSAMLDDALERKLKPIREKILHEPDETILSDERAARRLRVSVSTVRRWKKSGEVGSVSTPRGRMCRVCDIIAKETGGLL